MSVREIDRLLASAVSHQRAGRADAAAHDLRNVVALDPNQPAALNSLGMLALGRDDPGNAANLFARAAAADPGTPALWLNLAKAQRLLGDDEAERTSLGRVLEIDQRNLMALIRLAELHERLGETAKANQRWSAVIALGRSIDGRSPEFVALLERATAFVSKQGAAFVREIDEGLAAARGAVDRRDRRRFDACIDHTLGRRAIYSNQCEGTYFPFLPADEFFDREHFPWLDEIETKTDIIRGELEGLLEDGGAGFKPYVRQDPGTPRNKWTDLDQSLRWGAFFLWEYGVRDEAAAMKCPRTVAALEALPRADLPGRAPTCFFSLLKPKTRIPAHTGVTNTRAIVHLPLIVPQGCGFRVGGETREWRPGEAFVFDDTIEHEAWNDSDELRAVLIFDVWNPHLTEAEKHLLRSFYTVADASGHNPEPRDAR